LPWTELGEKCDYDRFSARFGRVIRADSILNLRKILPL